MVLIYAGLDHGAVSEDNAFLHSDWVAHTPPEVLSNNFGLAPGALSSAK
jgi:hypothetical protein